MGLFSPRKTLESVGYESSYWTDSGMSRRDAAKAARLVRQGKPAAAAKAVRKGKADASSRRAAKGAKGKK